MVIKIDSYHKKDQPFAGLEVNPDNWRNPNYRGFTMFSKKIKLQAILELAQGLPPSYINKKYGIKGSATIYEWKRHFNQFGVESFQDKQTKTYFDYSFKMKVIKWRFNQRASYPETAKQFKIKHPAVIWQWEKAFKEGRLNIDQRRSKLMSNKDVEKKSKEQLEEENRVLRVRVAYLEKLHALAQKKKDLQTKKKRK